MLLGQRDGLILPARCSQPLLAYYCVLSGPWEEVHWRGNSITMVTHTDELTSLSLSTVGHHDPEENFSQETHDPRHVPLLRHCVSTQIQPLFFPRFSPPFLVLHPSFSLFLFAERGPPEWRDWRKVVGSASMWGSNCFWLSGAYKVEVCMPRWSLKCNKPPMFLLRLALRL